MNYENTPAENAERANEAAGKVADAANHAWETTRDKAREALHTGERYVRDHPGASVLSIFGLGFVLGLVIGWSAAHEEHDNYLRGARRFARNWGKKLNLD